MSAGAAAGGNTGVMAGAEDRVDMLGTGGIPESGGARPSSDVNGCSCGVVRLRSPWIALVAIGVLSPLALRLSHGRRNGNFDRAGRALKRAELRTPEPMQFKRVAR